ncbi:MAG: hypothetical protein R6U86_01125 [Bacteroidales bacterium]
MGDAGHLTTYHALREKYPVFTYASYDYRERDGGLELNFVFRVGVDFIFRPRLFFHSAGPAAAKMAVPLLRSLVFHIGMVEAISYWKAFCSPVFRVGAHSLDQHQQAWWKKLFVFGLAEFFYTNGIPSPGESIFRFVFREGSQAPPAVELQEKGAEAAKGGLGGNPPETVAAKGGLGGNPPETLIPLGGGKDSVVTLELLKKAGLPIQALVINPRGATREVLQAAGIPQSRILEIDRTIDPLLLQLNSQGFLNGHTPFSAMLAFVSLLGAKLCGSAHIALSNESSANEATIPGTSINHQYSKSTEFESDFRSYVSLYISGALNYFSFLRPVNELQIGAMFSGMGLHHPHFKSCNAGSKTDSWCLKCPKCLFTFIILSPFLSPDQMQGIFGADLFNHAGLVSILDQLTGLAETKPFDCVGTTEEVNVALSYLVHKKEQEGSALPPLLEHYRKSGAHLPDAILRLKTHLASWSPGHHLQPPFLGVLREEVENLKKTDL